MRDGAGEGILHCLADHHDAAPVQALAFLDLFKPVLKIKTRAGVFYLDREPPP